MGRLKLTVTRHRDYSPDIWLMSCPGLGIDLRPLRDTNLVRAQKEALATARTYLMNAVLDVDKMLNQ